MVNLMARNDRATIPNEEYQPPKKKNFKETVGLVRRFLPYLRPHIGTQALVLFCTAVCAACEIALPLIVRKITDYATTDISLLTGKFIISVCVAYAGIKILDSVSNYLETYFGHAMGVKIENKMREDLFDHLHILSFSFFDNTKVGQLMSRMTSDLFDVAEWAHHFPEMVFTAVIKFGAGFYIFYGMDYRFAVAIFVMLPFMIIFTKRTRYQMKETFRKSRYQVGEINARTEDDLLGIRVVRSFTAEKSEKKKFMQGCKEYVVIKLKNYKWMSEFHAVVRIVDGFMYVAVVGFGAYFLSKGDISVGDFTASLLLVSTLLASIRTIIDFSEQFSRGVTGVERFEEVMNEIPEIVDSENAVNLNDVKGGIEFRNVSFSYSGDKRTVLNNLSFSLEPGKNLAIVGPSGGGKTTLCNLIPRFYEIDSGEILIDGTNIKDITLKSLRSNIGVVAQDVYLFSGTVRENIMYGNPDATDEEVEWAAKQAGAHDFIMELPHGYDTYTGERGVKLSGGQKQRISIARLFLKNPPILLLDEATSALDNESEKLVQESLERLAKGRTTLTIAHRLTTIRNADEIIVLTDKGIEEKGTHTELMSKNGLYSALYSMYAVM